VWYQGLDPSTQVVHKVYGLETGALQVFWGRFEHSDAVGVCVREREHLGVFMESGSVHYTAFPFVVSALASCQCYASRLWSHTQVKKVWPLECGVLVERLIEADSAYDGLPTLFSLLHPLDDFCPVTCRREVACE
jgi:hypothetical protein